MKWLVTLSSLVVVAATSNILADIANTSHNLSISGPGTIKATEEREICIFCHTPHNSSPVAPLWNRNSSGSNYTLYSSSTSLGLPGQPTGSSMLCLSCHDGTIALGEVLSRSTDILFSEAFMPPGNSNLGTDLSDDHPVSFEFTSGLSIASGELVNPASLNGAVKLDKLGQMQCTSCHDPHTETFEKFLVMSNTGSALCVTCHLKNYWTETSHSLSISEWNGLDVDPWPHTSEITVADNGCENCHSPHNAGGKPRILNYAVEEANCNTCHNGNVASHDIESEFAKYSSHPIINYLGDHDPVEENLVSTRHVECIDCHNPHASNASNPLNGVKGIDINGWNIDQVAHSYELCFRCHGDSMNKPVSTTTRQLEQTNTRVEFNTANPSYHPVVGIGKNSFVPSLILPLTTSSLISCLDCHNNDSNPNNNGTGPSGPHGSIEDALLERQYVTIDETTESTSVYAMCYKCHDRTSILSDESFIRHDFHITGAGASRGSNLSTPCNICHDPHASEQQERLMNFDVSVVAPSGSGRIEYNATVNGGECYLNCHGRDHDPCSYDRVTGTTSGCGGGGP